jgi:predicted nucleotidyltransferase component of viral defense system
MYTQTLPVKTANLLRLFTQKKPDFISSFYLSGGTALSLQLGHRESEDLDFFSREQFVPDLVEQQLHIFGALSETELAKGTVNTYIDGVKLQFLVYPYRLLEPLVAWEEIHLSSVEDIACTKLQTVGMRSSKKDFIDLYFLLQHSTLNTLLDDTKKKYAESDYSETHILKSLVYFDDADAQPMPRMHKDVSWEQVKKTIIEAVKSVPII